MASSLRPGSKCRKLFIWNLQTCFAGLTLKFWTYRRGRPWLCRFQRHRHVTWWKADCRSKTTSFVIEGTAHSRSTHPRTVKWHLHKMTFSEPHCIWSINTPALLRLSTILWIFILIISAAAAVTAVFSSLERCKQGQLAGRKYTNGSQTIAHNYVNFVAQALKNLNKINLPWNMMTRRKENSECNAWNEKVEY